MQVTGQRQHILDRLFDGYGTIYAGRGPTRLQRIYYEVRN